MNSDVGWITRPPGPEAGEYLAALRVVPVAEGDARNELIGGKRAAMQDTVLLAEEDLGVRTIGKRAEAGVREEVRRRPLPDVSARAPREDRFAPPIES